MDSPRARPAAARARSSQRLLDRCLDELNRFGVCPRRKWKATTEVRVRTRSRRLCLPALAVGALAIDNERLTE